MKKLLTSLAAAAAILFASHGAWAGDATNVVRNNQAKMFELIAQPKSAVQQAKLKTLFDEFIDYDEMVHKSLGKKWDTLNADQQSQFSVRLTQLIRSNYRKNLKALLKFNIEYDSEESMDSGVLVNSEAKHKTDKREPPFELDFLMKQKNGKWVIADIIPEEASMVKTYKAQFLRILKKKGFEELIKKMDKKLAKLKKEIG
jgi:phospholipid transport system substrate-binding protein